MIAPGGHIWVVDDSPLQLERARAQLAGRYAVEVFADGGALLERVSQGARPDVLLLDWQMPGVSGLDVCSFLRERYDEVSLPILVLTASGARADRDSALRAGANGFLTKPSDEADLLARLGTLVRIRQQAEVLRVREAWLSTTLSSIGDAVIATDTSGRITFLNAVAQALTGFRQQEVEGRPLAEAFRIVNEQTRKPAESPVDRALREAVATGRARHTLLIRKDGTEICIEESAAPIRAGQGELSGVVLVFRDVTRQRELDDILARRARHSRLAADVGQALTRIVDQRQVLERCAQALVEHLDAALARVWLVDAEGRELQLEASAGLTSSIDGTQARVPVGSLKIGLIAQERRPYLTNAVVGEPRVVDQEWARSERLVSFAGFPLLVGDKLIGVVALFSRRALPGDTLEALRQVADSLALGVERLRSGAERERLLLAAEAERARVEALARKLRASEERLRRVVDASGAGLWELDASTGEINADGHLLPLMGLPADTRFTLRAALQSVHPEERDGVARAVSAALRGESGGRYLETFRTIGQDGMAERWVESRGQRFLDEEGRVSGVGGVMVDVSARKRAEAVGAELVKALGIRAEFERHLVGIVSHDLRNPLNAILLSADLLARAGNLDEGASRSVQRIRFSAQRAARMIRDLLDFTQARLGGGIRVDPQPANLHEVVRRVLDEVVAVHPGRQVLTRHEGDGQGVWDADRISQVVQNLVNNALHYSPPASAVQVSTAVEGDRVSLAVRNQGTPIDPGKLGSIFEPLQRGTTQADHAERNVGLGLYIVRQIVSAHGGAVEVQSTEHLGTTFTVRLPREVRSADARVAAQPAS